MMKLPPNPEGISRRRALVVPAALLGAVCLARAAAADEPYPTRPIRVIVAYPPGGPTDVMGRLISQALSESLASKCSSTTGPAPARRSPVRSRPPPSPTATRC